MKTVRILRFVDENKELDEIINCMDDIHSIHYDYWNYYKVNVKKLKWDKTFIPRFYPKILIIPRFFEDSYSREKANLPVS